MRSKLNGLLASMATSSGEPLIQSFEEDVVGPPPEARAGSMDYADVHLGREKGDGTDGIPQPAARTVGRGSAL